MTCNLCGCELDEDGLSDCCPGCLADIRKADPTMNIAARKRDRAEFEARHQPPPLAKDGQTDFLKPGNPNP